MNSFQSTALAFLVLPTLGTADELLFDNSDFEKGTLENWTAEGDAFTRQPTKGDNPAARNREPSQHQGEFWIGTYENYDGVEGKPGANRSDKPKGTLTSIEFTIPKRYLTFRIGAGHLPKEVGVKLLCEGEEHFMSSGFDSESMELVSFDAGKLVGKKARLVIFDDASGGWGHINADDFRGTDQPAPQPNREFRLTDGISASGYPDTGYDQPLRPQFHFTSRKNWLNDPNGMVYNRGKYHLFFQHNPKGTAWGNMTWGHAISEDMVHWKQLDHALLPYEVDRRRGTIFSGTAVVDFNNSLGVQEGDRKTLVAFFTFATKPKFYQAMAYSTDGGMTWTYWNDGKAIVDNQGFDNGERDPKVFWHEPSERWVMALWVSRNPGRVRFFTSRNLTDWEFASDLLRDWAYECMDVFFAPVDGDPKNTKCVIYDASFDYEIGTFDGKVFTSETGHQKMSGGNFYAAQTFNQTPRGRAVQIGWMRGGPNSAKVYGLPFNQQMAFPTELTVRSTKDGLRLNCWPITEIESLVTTTHSLTNKRLGPGVNALAGVADLAELDLLDVVVDLEPGTAKEIVFDLPRTSIVYDVVKQTLTHSGVDDDGKPKRSPTIAKLAPRDGVVSLRFLIDRLSLEAFVNRGEDFGAHYIHPEHGPKTHSIHAVGGEAVVRSLEVHELKSAWK